MKSRRNASTVGASSAGHATSPARMVGPSGCSSNVKSVTTPKLPPPPRRPQNRSGFSAWEARTMEPSAVTTWQDLSASIASPIFRMRWPMPPPSVSPAMPVWLM